jgi:hypothetical protein
MSHISTSKLSIKGVVGSVAENAFNNLQQLGYTHTVNGTVTAMDQKKANAQYVFTGPGLQEYGGIGVNIKNGEFEIVGETWGSARSNAVNKLKDAIAAGYSAEAYREALIDMGMSVSMSYADNGEIVLEGEVYA